MNVTSNRQLEKPEDNDSTTSTYPKGTSKIYPLVDHSSSGGKTEPQDVAVVTETTSPVNSTAPPICLTVSYLTGPRLWLVKYA
jgi:hypothetical protein